MQIFKYFSTFSGIGGFELGIGDRGECVGFSELDKHAIATYQKHFPNHKNYGDITKIKADTLPDFDLLVGGFPCQAFSIAGNRRGFADTRGTLFFEIARIAKEKQPRLLLLENVKGLLSHGNGATFYTIIATLDELGYDVQWQVLNSKNHGVPQNRERVFIVGHLRGTPRPEVFPFTGANEETTGAGVTSTTIDANYGKGIDNHGARTGIYQLNNPTHSNDRVYGAEGLSPMLNTMQGGNRQPFVMLTETRTEEAKRIRRENMKNGLDWSPRRGKELVPRNDDIAGTLTANQGKEHFVLIPEATKKGYAEATVGQSINLAVPNSKTRRGRVSDIAQTLDTGMQQHTLTSDMRIRRLTPIECERLQGFPDNWTAGVSDTQRYKQCGNAVTVNVIRDIIDRLVA